MIGFRLATVNAARQGIIRNRTRPVLRAGDRKPEGSRGTASGAGRRRTPSGSLKRARNPKTFTLDVSHSFKRKSVSNEIGLREIRPPAANRSGCAIRTGTLIRCSAPSTGSASFGLARRHFRRSTAVRRLAKQPWLCRAPSPRPLVIAGRKPLAGKCPRLAMAGNSHGRATFAAPRPVRLQKSGNT